MFERFTDRARKVMQLANMAAQRLDHEYLGTEHILLGILADNSGVAANVLKNLDVDFREVERQIMSIVQKGPDMVVMGKLPMTPRTKKVLEYAIQSARELNHNYIGTEHLLLGLMKEGNGVAAQCLLNMGLKLEDITSEVKLLLGIKEPRKMKLAYVSGKYTDKRGAYFMHKNIELAHTIGAMLWSVGVPNICPHANTYHMDGISDYETFIDGDLIMVERSDLIIMMPNWLDSRGAKMEHEHALKHQVPIYYWPENFKEIIEFCHPAGIPYKYLSFSDGVLTKELYAELASMEAGVAKAV